MTVSARYVEVQPDQVNDVIAELDRTTKGWKDASIPKAQRALVQQELASFRQGGVIAPYTVFTRLFKLIDPAPKSVLDIGCSSGYYSEVLEILGWSGHYTGIDFSEPFIDMARKLYPTRDFFIDDATQILLHAELFDLTISGGCIIHIPTWELAIVEAARVTKSGGHVILHRTGISRTDTTRFWRKEAYGIPCLEIHVGRSELQRVIEEVGLKTLHGEIVSSAEEFTTESILCQKA